jgi:hypothetical protein
MIILRENYALEYKLRTSASEDIRLFRLHTWRYIGRSKILRAAVCNAIHWRRAFYVGLSVKRK